MKLLTHAALVAVLTHAAMAAEHVPHFEAALERAKVTGKDIVVFQHGSDWNPLSERLYANVWMKPAFAKAAGEDVILVAVDQLESVGGTAATALKQIADTKSPAPPSELIAVESTGGAQFKPRADGAWLAEGANPAGETLRLKLVPKAAGTVVRIDFPTDPTLPGNGPGRAPNGNFVIQKVEIVAGQKVFAPRDAWASKHSANEGAWRLADGLSGPEDSFWNPAANDHQQRTLVIVLPQPATAGTELELRLVCGGKYTQHVPGCIRAAILPGPAIESDVLNTLASEKLQRQNAKFTWRGVNVPRVALLDRESREIASEDRPRSVLTPASLAARLHDLQKKRIQRDALWAAADKVQGLAKAELLRQSLDLLGLGNSIGQNKSYAFIHEQIKAADPKDESGAQRWLQFSTDSRGVPKMVSDALKLVTEKKYDEALAALDRELADPRNRILDHDRLQRIMLGRFQVYRQWPGREEERFEEMRKIAALDPTTYHGIGATGYVAMHHRTPAPELVYYGWGAAQVKDGLNTWDLKITEADNIDHAGPYTLRILHNGGKDAVKIHRIALVEDGKETFESRPDASLDPRGKIEIPLTVKSWNPARKPLIRIELEASAGKTDSSGRLEFEPLLEAAAR